MPARKSPPDAKPRMIALLRKAAETGSVIRAAGAIGEKRPQLIEDAIRMSEAVHVELMGPGQLNNATYNEACRAAADRMEAA